ncbi:ParA family protein [Kitasatospora sp. NPDC127060]|uniref:ParA family protein n=1 Tax=Kitasatospora sp. NPDC127060 TaxID=3347121 RepID=UPI0036632E78
MASSVPTPEEATSLPKEIKKPTSRLLMQLASNIARNRTLEYPRRLAFGVRAGGAIKTHNVLNLGITLARRGFKLRLWDLDPQRTLSAILGYKEPAPGQMTIFDVMIGKATLAQATVQARYRTGVGDEDDAFTIIPNLYLVHGTEELGNAEVTLASDPAGNLWLDNLLSDQPEDDDFIDLVDTGPTRGLLQTSIMIAFEDWVGCLNDEYKYISGLNDLERDMEEARRKFRRLRVKTNIRFIQISGVYLHKDGTVNRGKSAIADDSVNALLADEEWSAKLLPITRYEQKAKEVFERQKPLRFHAPMSPALDDCEAIADGMGYPRRAPGKAS